jgi:hypothetical protein
MKISDEVLILLGGATADGRRLVLPARLDPAQYSAVDKVLQAAGGKWSRKDRAHVFQGDAVPVLAGLLDGGEVTTPAEEGWFPTPPAVVEQLLDAAGARPGMTVLEPSAGTGAIARAAAELGCVVDCVELNADRVRVLADAGFARRVMPGDFLAFQPGGGLAPDYDRVLMNPPFAGKADVAHVVHARRFLAPGGMLAAVMSAGTLFRADKVTTAFRDGVLEAGGLIEPLPEGAFQEAGTDVRTVLVTVPYKAVLDVPAPEPKKRPRKMTPDQARAAAEVKRTRMDAIIGKGLDQLTDPAAWAAFMGRGSRLGRYSFRNQVLIIMQCPIVSDVAGYAGWQERGRQVRDGEEGLLIFAPRTKKTDDDGTGGTSAPGEKPERRIAGLKAASVYDISQTDPVPGREFRPADAAAGKTFAEIREAVAALDSEKAAAVLAAMDAGAALAVSGAAATVPEVREPAPPAEGAEYAQPGLFAAS